MSGGGTNPVLPRRPCADLPSGRSVTAQRFSPTHEAKMSGLLCTTPGRYPRKSTRGRSVPKSASNPERLCKPIKAALLLNPTLYHVIWFAIPPSHRARHAGRNLLPLITYMVWSELIYKLHHMSWQVCSSKKEPPRHFPPIPHARQNQFQSLWVGEILNTKSNGQHG